MGGFAMAMAGALQGLGSGMATKGKMDLEQKYLQAIENLRSGNKMTENQMEYNNQDRNSARSDARRLNSDLTIQRDSQKFQSGMASAGAKAAESAAEADRNFKREQAERDRAFEADQKARDRAQDLKVSFGKPVSEQTDETNGNVTHIYKDPKTGKTHTEVFKGIAKKTPSGSGSSLLLTNPAPAKKETPLPKTATRAQVAELAKESKMSFEQAKLWVEARGTKVE